MPSRLIKEGVCTSKGLSECSVFAGDLFKRLITYADDYGRFNADTQIMVARLYPRELDVVSEDDIQSALIELAGVGKIRFYTSSPRKEVYGCFPNWDEHQRVRNLKSKCPDPDDTAVNDWYLRRFISIDMREKIIARDNFKCQICGKFLTTMRDAKRFAKLGSGLYHIDHIVPVVQGGRATEENLRLSCPTCNQSRKKHFDVSEILDLPIVQQSAASCGELRQKPPGIQSNPIQSESESNKGAKRADMSPLDIAMDDFAKARKAMRKPLTDKARELTLRDLEKLAPGDDAMKVAILNQSIQRGWQGVFPLKDEKPTVKCYMPKASEGPKKDDADRLMSMLGVER